MNTNTAIIGALIANPSVFIGKFIAEPLAGAALAYGLVWLFMRPKDGRTVPNPFLWHALGVAAAVAGGAMFRIVAMVTFAGRSAYEPVAKTGAAGFYLLIVPAIAAAGYIAWLKTRMAPKSVAASQINVSAQTAVSKPTSSEPTGNDAFAEALAEIEENRIDKGTWARCYAVCDGDEVKAKAAYIKARAAVMGATAVWVHTQPAGLDGSHINTSSKAGSDNQTSTDFFPRWLVQSAIGLAVFAVLLAIALPAYQDYSKRRAVVETPAQAPSNYFDQFDTPRRPVAATPTQVPALEVIDWNKGEITPPATQVQDTPSPSVANPYVYGKPVETASLGPILKVEPPIISDYQRAEALAFETKERARKAKIEADLKEVSERAVKDYPYLETPAGEEDLKKIISKRDEMIQQGVYPSLALTRAVLAVAAYRERQPAQEVRKVNSAQYQSSPETMKNTATEVDAPKSVQPTPPLSASYVQKVRGLQAAVQRGEIPLMNGVVSFWQPTNPAQWLSSDAAVLESTQTWWQEKSNDFLIHVKNTTANPLVMLGIDYSRGACNSNGAKTSFYLTPSRRITPGSQAIVNFKIELPVSAQTKGCLVIVSAGS